MAFVEEFTRIGSPGMQGVLVVGTPTDTRIGMVIFNSMGLEMSGSPAKGVGIWVNTLGALMYRVVVDAGTFVAPSNPSQGTVVGDNVSLGSGSIDLLTRGSLAEITSFGAKPERPEPAVDGRVNTVVLAAAGHDAPGLLVLAAPNNRYAYLWADSDGCLRINGTKPTNQDADGMAVGVQVNSVNYGTTIFASSNANGLFNTDNVHTTVLGNPHSLNIAYDICILEREQGLLVFETVDAGGTLHQYYVWSHNGGQLRIVENLPTNLVSSGVNISGQTCV